MLNIFVRGAVVAAIVASTPAFAAGSASVTTRVNTSANVSTTQLAGLGSQDFALSSSGTANYTISPAGGGSGGAGGTGGAQSSFLGWDATVAADPTSTAQGTGSVSQFLDTDGNPIPNFYVSNFTELTAPLRIRINADFATTGATSGDSGVTVFNQATFAVYCSSCTGLLQTFYIVGGSTYFYGGYYGVASGAFSDSGSNEWDLNLTLNPNSTASIFINSVSSVDLIAIGSAIPEPSSWAMMLAGFAGLGGQLRRRRASLSMSTPA